MKKFTNTILKTLGLILLLVVIGFAYGDMVESSLQYIAGRGAMIRDAFIMLVCFGIRYGMDVSSIRKNKGNRLAIGVSPIVFDMIKYLASAGLLILTIILFIKGIISVTLAVLFMTIVVTVLFELDRYVECVPELTENQSGEEENTATDEEREYSNEIEENESYKDADDEYDDDYEFDDDNYERIQKLRQEKKLKKELKKNKKAAKKKSGGLKKYFADIKEKRAKELEFDDSDYDEETSRGVDSDKKPGLTGRKILVQILKASSYVMPILMGVLTFADIHAKVHSGLYFLAVIIIAILSVGVRAAYMGIGSPDESPEGNEKLIGYFVATVILTVFLCFYSILIGLVFLLGTFLVAVIIPLALDNWGTGGTEAVNMSKDSLSRLVSRVFSVIIMLLVVWQLSYGAIWEIDFMVIVAVAVCQIGFMSDINCFSYYSNSDSYFDLDADSDSDADIDSAMRSNQ